jgi:hypothetical protein
MKTLLELTKKNSEDIFENKNIGIGEQLYHSLHKSSNYCVTCHVDIIEIKAFKVVWEVLFNQIKSQLGKSLNTFVDVLEIKAFKVVLQVLFNQDSVR